jgi:hypothetical protein
MQAIKALTDAAPANSNIKKRIAPLVIDPTPRDLTGLGWDDEDEDEEE